MEYLPALKVTNSLGLKGYLIGFLYEGSRDRRNYSSQYANIQKPYVLWAGSLIPVETIWDDIELDPDDLIERFLPEDICVLLKSENIHTIGMLQFLSRIDLSRIKGLSKKPLDKLEAILNSHEIELPTRESRRISYIKDLGKNVRRAEEGREIDAEFFLLREQGLKYSEIAVLKNVSTGRVSERLKRHRERINAQ